MSVYDAVIWCSPSPSATSTVAPVPSREATRFDRHVSALLFVPSSVSVALPVSVRVVPEGTWAGGPGSIVTTGVSFAGGGGVNPGTDTS